MTHPYADAPNASQAAALWWAHQIRENYANAGEPIPPGALELFVRTVQASVDDALKVPLTGAIWQDAGRVRLLYGRAVLDVDYHPTTPLLKEAMETSSLRLAMLPVRSATTISRRSVQACLRDGGHTVIWGVHEEPRAGWVLGHGPGPSVE
ncbi:hypothetical protein ACWGI8_40045 [Streptomyces sp. NPDC054841]